jgi:hypothetical protein
MEEVGFRFVKAKAPHETMCVDRLENPIRSDPLIHRPVAVHRECAETVVLAYNVEGRRYAAR